MDTIVELAAAKKRGQRLVVAGCLTALHGEELRAEIPEIDAVFGAEAWNGIGAYAQTVVPLRLDAQRYDLPRTTRSRSSDARTRAYLKISDGCNAPCTFCIIPKMKGKLHSTPADALVDEARRLAAEGVREIVLVAQDSTDYGRDLGLRDGLPALLERLSDAVPEVPWLRLMYAYPGHVTRRLAETMARAAERRAVHRYPAAARERERASPNEAPEQHAHGARDVRDAARGDAGHRAADDVHRRLSGRDGAGVRRAARLRARDGVRPRRLLHVLAAVRIAGGARAGPGAGAREEAPAAGADGSRAAGIDDPQPHARRARDRCARRVGGSGARDDRWCAGRRAVRRRPQLSRRAGGRRARAARGRVPARRFRAGEGDARAAVRPRRGAGCCPGAHPHSASIQPTTTFSRLTP